MTNRSLSQISCYTRGGSDKRSDFRVHSYPPPEEPYKRVWDLSVSQVVVTGTEEGVLSYP